MMGKQKLNVEGFDGIVNTMDWVTMPDGEMYKSIRGKVSILSAQDAVGFEPTGHNSANWIARIDGPKSTVTLMGCQVRSVIDGDLSVWPVRKDTLVVP
jgi:hypothetical protein